MTGHPALRRAPFEINDLSVILMRIIHTAQFHSQTVVPRCGVNPAGGVALLEDVGHGRQVHEMDSAGVFPNLPLVRVAENVSLHLLARPDDFEKRQGVLQSHVSLNTRIMMDQDNRRLRGIGV